MAIFYLKPESTIFHHESYMRTLYNSLCINPDATTVDLLDAITACAQQLGATTALISGEGFDAFADMADAVQQTLLGGLARHADELEVLARALHNEMLRLPAMPADSDTKE